LQYKEQHDTWRKQVNSTKYDEKYTYCLIQEENTKPNLS